VGNLFTWIGEREKPRLEVKEWIRNTKKNMEDLTIILISINILEIKIIKQI
jgi:hypothetical protein